MKKLTAAVLFLLLSLAFLTTAHPAELAGVTVPDSMVIGGSEVPLSGMGIRKKLVIKVYVAGVYTSQGVAGAAGIIDADEPKALSMTFVYKEVGADSLQGAWRDGFENNTPDPSPDLKQRMDRFVVLFTEPAVRGDVYLLTYQPGEGTRIVLKGREVDLIPGADFMRALFAIWFGDKPADKGLKKSVLRGM